jgi:hypothetical protein
MPAAMLASFARQAGVGMDRAEHLWDKAKGIVRTQYGLKEPDGKTSKKARSKFYRLVTGIVKGMMRLKDDYEPVLLPPDVTEDLRALGMGKLADAVNRQAKREAAAFKRQRAAG